MDHGAGGEGNRGPIGREVEPIERGVAKDRADRDRQGGEEPERGEHPRSAEDGADQDEMDDLNVKGPCRHQQDGRTRLQSDDAECLQPFVRQPVPAGGSVRLAGPQQQDARGEDNGSVVGRIDPERPVAEKAKVSAETVRIALVDDLGHQIAGQAEKTKDCDRPAQSTACKMALHHHQGQQESKRSEHRYFPSGSDCYHPEL
jgi:hypothetical protein